MEFARATAAVDEVAALAAEPRRARGGGRPLRAAAAEIEALDLTDPLGAAPVRRASAGAATARFDRLATARLAARDAAGRAWSRPGTATSARRAALAARIDEVEAAERAVAQAQSRPRRRSPPPGWGRCPPPRPSCVDG